MKSDLVVADYFDSPEVLDASVTPIPNALGAPIQVVASLAKTVYGLSVGDGISQYFIGLYKGPAGSESLVCVLGAGTLLNIPVFLPRGTRVSLRSMTSDVISSGVLCVLFLGSGQ